MTRPNTGAAPRLSYSLLTGGKFDHLIPGLRTGQSRRKPGDGFHNQMALTVNGNDVIAVIQNDQLNIASEFAAQIRSIAKGRIVVFKRVHNERWLTDVRYEFANGVHQMAMLKNRAARGDWMAGRRRTARCARPLNKIANAAIFDAPMVRIALLNRSAENTLSPVAFSPKAARFRCAPICARAWP